MASSYKLTVKRLEKTVGRLHGFALDQPCHNQAITDDELSGGRLRLFGWVLAEQPEQQLQLYISEAGQRTDLTLNTERPDVIHTVLGEEATDHSQLICGFDHQLSVTADQLTLGVTLNGKDIPLFDIEVHGSLKVLQGRDDWLFLDNDANDSVAQHTGRMALGLLSRWGWQRFFKRTQQLAQPFSLLIAPSKETVYPDAYPIPKQGRAPIEQMLDLAPTDYPVVYPVQALSSYQQRTFRKNDTHWSLYGASVASRELLLALGLSRYADSFNDDSYVERDVIGDLGNKLYPPMLSKEASLKGANYHPQVVYDNQLPNFGRALVVQNDKAPLDSTLLMFASSSGYSMLHYLYRVFKRIVFVHTAGNIDRTVISAVAADYVISQTNARFVIRAPKVGVSLQKLMRSKLKLESESARHALLERSSKQSEQHPGDAVISYLHTLLKSS